MLRWFAAVLVSLGLGFAAQAQEPMSGDELAAIDERTRSQAEWLAEGQSVIAALVNGPLDPRQSIAIIEQANSGLLDRDIAMSQLDNLREVRRGQTASLRARRGRMHRPEEWVSPEGRNLADQLDRTLDALFDQAESILDIEAQMIDSLGGGQVDFRSLQLAEFEGRRLFIRSLIDMNEAGRLAQMSGHPQEFFINCMIAGGRAMIAIVDMQERVTIQNSTDGLSEEADIVSRQARLIRRWAGAGRNAVEPTLREFERYSAQASDVHVLQIQPQVLATYGPTFDAAIRMADALDALSMEVVSADEPETFWSVVNRRLAEFSAAESTAMSTQEERVRLYNGQ